jgi:hypothetical protein
MRSKMYKGLLAAQTWPKELEMRPEEGLCKVERGLKWDLKHWLVKAYKLEAAHSKAR